MAEAAAPAATVDPDRLRADCSRCAGLCCVVPPFTRSADFALDKPAGVPCPHLADDAGPFGCTIHEELRPRGFPGCVAYDCFGAGQLVVQHIFGGATWRGSGQVAGEMFAVFSVVRPLHELLWLLTEAMRLPEASPVRPELTRAAAGVEKLVRSPVAVLRAVDVDEQRASVVPLLRRASRLARAEAGGPDLSGVDLAGRRLTDLYGSLRGANLRGALLLGADLRGADLDLADVTGADLRSADVRGTDLRRVLFLSQQQVAAARGDALTMLPPRLDRPAHWHRAAGA